MLFDLKCSRCKQKFWSVSYDPKQKKTLLQCAKCGNEEVYEEVLGIKRRTKNVKKEQTQTELN